LKIRAALGGLALLVVQLFLILLDRRVADLDKPEAPALLPDPPLQLFTCILAFLPGHAFFLIPSPRRSSRVVTFAALRSLMVGVTTAAISFQLLYLLSRPPSAGQVSPSQSPGPWPEIMAAAIWISVLPTWLSFLKFAGDGFEARLDRKA
jgi:hypothetical protein